MKELKIVFMGTPEFAVESLKVLVEGDANIVGVITAPDKPKGRGRKLSHSPVKEYALSEDLTILQPTNLKANSFLEELRALKADLQIVVAFRMLPEVVWNMPRLGTFNLHASLLPNYRGAAPINWAIINGDHETGVTTFFLQHEIDTGDVIFQEVEPIHESDDVGSLYERLMSKGAKLVLKTVKSISEGSYQLSPQIQSNESKSAPKIFKETCEIDWNQDMRKVHDFIRGLSPYPTAWTILQGKKFKIFKTKLSSMESLMKPQAESNVQSVKSIGEIDSDNKSYLRVNCADGALEILELMMEGKKRMKVEEFLRGFQFSQTIK